MTLNDVSDGVSFEEFFNGIPTASMFFDEAGEPISCNHAMVALLACGSRRHAGKYFTGAELKRNITNYETNFVHTCTVPGTNEQRQFIMNVIPFKSGVFIACAREINIEEARGQLMLNSAPMAVTFYNKSFNVVDCNMEAVRMFGFVDKADFIEHFYRLMPPIQPNGRSSKKLLNEFVSEAFRSGYSKNEFIRQKIDGTLMHTEASFVREEHRGEYVVLGYSRDLTDVYAAMEREREARETAQIYMDTSPIGMELWDEQMQIVNCNRQIFEMFGFVDKNSFISRVKDDWAGEHVTPVFLQQALEDGYARYEWDFTRLDGKVLPCEVRLVRVVRDNMPQVMAYFLDLSDVKKAIDAAREADKRAMLMLDATPLACFLVRENVTALDCNLAAVDLFGFENKVDALQRYREIFPTISPDGRPQAVPASLEWVNTSEPMRFEFNHRSVATNEYIPCEVTMVYLDYQGNPIMACYMRDLREIKAMIAEMKRIEVAEEESRAKSQFLARMSHEIRTPLNSIMGVSDIQLLKGGHPPEIEESFLQIRSSSNILLSIINDILDLSKVEAGKMEIHNTPYEIASLIFDTVQLNLMHVGSKSIQFNLHVDENMPNILVGDELRIKQVLNNLLSNAFKYTREGEVNLTFMLEDVDGDDAILLVELQDSGQGMTASQLASLFEGEYVRFNEAENRLIEGTGLGMNITNRMISMMKGKISAISELGVGSTFYVRLPQKIGSRDVLGKEIVKNLQNFQLSQRSFQKRFHFEYEHMPYGSVLVVDDVESNLFVAKGLLVPYGLNVETAISGFDALDKIKAGKVFDIIFMDHMMPEMDGIETAKALRNLGYNEPIVALTANTIIGQAELFMSSGFSGFISKPIDVTKMNGYLMTLIRDKQPPDVLASAKAASPSSSGDLSGALVNSFLRDAERSLGILEALLKNENWGDDEYKLYTINTHGLKSALANVGKTHLSGTAGSLEQAGRDKSADLIRKETSIFLSDLRDVVISLMPRDVSSVDSSTEDMTLLNSGLGKIKKACDSYNKKAARGALEEINKRTWSKETKVFLDQIAVNLLHSAFEEVIEDIDRFIKK
ncbi:MAG: response regulator [Clostridiales bacterium]|jgi:signal transduction histidine kinase/CheY-like chemotaxis protein/HPt (histidine-containing phosphotransfer) domain-containing protein|nr:response regulator [Clostridiales bacterium]